MKRKTALTQELADLLRKYAIDSYCVADATKLAIQLVSSLEDVARVAVVKNLK